MGKVKQHIAIFYLTLILLFKVGGLHALTHHAEDANIEHCEVCIVTAAVNFTPLLETETPVLPQAEYLFLEQKLTNSDSFVVFNNKHLSSYLFTRPPPQLS
jgi:hypothetical protein